MAKSDEIFEKITRICDCQVLVAFYYWFDNALQVSPVEFMGFNPTEAYTHFKTFGYKEGRPYRFLC